MANMDDSIITEFSSIKGMEEEIYSYKKMTEKDYSDKRWQFK